MSLLTKADEIDKEATTLRDDADKLIIAGQEINKAAYAEAALMSEKICTLIVEAQKLELDTDNNTAHISHKKANNMRNIAALIFQKASEIKNTGQQRENNHRNAAASMKDEATRLNKLAINLRHEFYKAGRTSQTYEMIFM